MWPGMQLQKLTTREPDHEQLAVAIAAMEAVLAVETPRRADRGGPASASKSSPMIESLVEQIEARFAELGAADGRPRGDRRPASATPRRAASTAGSSPPRSSPRSGGARPTTRPARRSCSTRGDDAELRELLAHLARAGRGARGGDAARDGRGRPQRRQERHRRGPGRRRRRRGRAVGGRRLPDAHQVRRAPRAQDRDARGRRGQVHASRSRATAPTRSSSSRAGRIACSACR